MKLGRNAQAAIGILLGGALLGALFLWRGIDTVAALLADGGMALFLVCLLSPPEQFLSAEAWRALFPPALRPGRLRVWLAAWMGDAVNVLLPVATIGGEIAKARVLILWSAPGAPTVAAVAVDKAMQAVAVLAWALIGATFLAFAVGTSKAVVGVYAGALVLAAGIGGFLAILSGGGLGRMAAGIAARTRGAAGQALVENTEAVEAAIREIFAHRRRMGAAVAVLLVQRVMLAGELVLVGALMGTPIGVAEAVMLKGIIGAVRGVSFAVPGALGVQEGGYVAVGALLGYPPELMVAVSLATRIREIVPNIPMFVVWQATEGRAWWRGIRDGKAGGTPGR